MRLSVNSQFKLGLYLTVERLLCEVAELMV